MGWFEVISFYAALVHVLGSITSVASEVGRIHKISSPTSIALPLNDETILICEMNIVPDKFEWRFYKLDESQVSNPNALLNLTRDYVELPPKRFTNDKKKSTLTIKLTNSSSAGDYQCLAHYGASVVASVPDRITLTTLRNFPVQHTTHAVVSSGNTVVWKCDPPYSNPAAYVDYYYKDKPCPNSQGSSLVLQNIAEDQSGLYKCQAMNSLNPSSKVTSSGNLNITVKAHMQAEKPRFIVQPQSIYILQKGQTLFLECGAVGTPVPTVSWEKKNGILPKNRTEFVAGGLRIVDVVPEDDGVYICKYSNYKGSATHLITAMYNEEPTIIHGPKSTHAKEGENLELECTARGVPQPRITWFLNGQNVLGDKNIEAVENILYFVPFEKRHAGIIQCFATNMYGTTYSSADLEVIPKQISSANAVEDVVVAPVVPNHKRGKNNKKLKHKGTAEMIPPGRPIISRLNDESVVVRWFVPTNDGLPIQFFKVQYKELGPGKRSKWKTTNNDIAPNIRSYEVNNLKPEHTYKFRIAAVYSNNDNKLSPISDKFHLIRADFSTNNPLPIPILKHTETINTTSIRIFWEYTPFPNITVDGFYVNYMSASSAGDYMKATVEDEKTNTYIITHLIPDTVYDIKLQSFNSKMAGLFSPILKQKTDKLATESPLTTTVKSKSTDESASDSQLYIFIGVGVLVVTVLLSVVVPLIICTKWKQSKEAVNARGERTNKSSADEISHHIQAEANEYVVTQKNSKNNGCGPNRITITANPLADADNKNILARIFSRVKT
ncbi:PREDICTED: interference hedgehog-like isoform X2 [Nicrophorus vespilloides]|uniref:Interference hedgehog n=1 Tax=Nicrophorus vespilloides TaxID=110193 RepID=A0ABM1NKJ4_NICVS|nr:PREDICTED: interference hedgehog-like isoform X2 [Nicrophorus vespilloides]